MTRERFARLCPLHREPILAPMVAGPSGFIEMFLCPRGHFVRAWSVVEWHSERTFATTTTGEALVDDDPTGLRRAA